MTKLSQVFERAIDLMRHEPYYTCRTIDRVAGSFGQRDHERLQREARALYWELCSANPRYRRYHIREPQEALANQDLPHFWNQDQFAEYKADRIYMLDLARQSAERMHVVYAKEHDIPMEWKP